jgi:hypothetical protein
MSSDQSNGSSTTAYALIGGAEAIRQLVDWFNDLFVFNGLVGYACSTHSR